MPATHNVNVPERIASAALGAALIALGAMRRSILFTMAGAPLLHRGLTGRCFLYRALNINTDEVHRELHITIDRPVEDVYRYWRTLANLPRIWPQLISMRELSSILSRWRIRTSTGRAISFDVQLIEQRDNELLAWRTVGQSALQHRGEVEFRPGRDAQSTEVKLTYWYKPAWGVFTSAHCVQETQNGLKQIARALEAGEIATHTRARSRPMDEVEENSQESFPASDAPSFTPGRA